MKELHDFKLEGSRTQLQPLKMCANHKELKPPEGGCQLTPKRWVCSRCWLAISRRLN